ncbi:ABC transporter substrate-binding protein [Inquilinus sp. CA228]|uniref:ABC transporter substrate-binding protein n=1 Tax=Inquilinus sp. CA228 TaxID=3455609 RepID=UPI003F8D70AF
MTTKLIGRAVLRTAHRKTAGIAGAVGLAALLLAGAAQADELVIAGRDGVYGDALAYAIDAYKTVSPDTEVELLKLPYGSLYEKLVVSLRGGADAYDVVVADDTWMPEFTANGWLKPVTADLSGVIPSLTALSKGKDGQVVALPFAGNVEMFAYRTDLFQAAGLAAPKSWSDVVKAAEALKAKDPSVAGVVFRGTKGNPIVTGFLPIFWAHGGEIIDGSGKAALASPAGVKALQQFLALKAFAPTGVETYNATEVRDALQQGRAAMAIEVWPAWVPSLDDAAKSKVVGKVAIGPAPGETKGPAPMLGIWQVAVPSGAPNAEGAQKFLAFLNGADMQKELALRFGLPPTLTALYADKDLVAKYRWYPDQLKALEAGVSRPRIKQWPQVESILGDYLQLALVGQMAPEEALTKASADIDKALAK